MRACLLGCVCALAFVCAGWRAGGRVGSRAAGNTALGQLRTSRGYSAGDLPPPDVLVDTLSFVATYHVRALARVRTCAPMFAWCPFFSALSHTTWLAGVEGYMNDEFVATVPCVRTVHPASLFL